MKNNPENIFEGIEARVEKLNELKNSFEAEAAEAKKECARRKIIESVVFHETQIPLEAVKNIIEMSVLKMGRKPAVNNVAAMTAIGFNLELIEYIQSYLSADFDSSFNMETDFDIREVLFTALFSLYNKFRQKNVVISTRLYETPVIVNTDKFKLYCILLNLLDNALKFSKSGDEIIVSTMVTAERMLKLEFLDHGGGFDGEKVENFFPNGKLSVSLNESDPKTGLLIIYKYLEEMGGYLELETRPSEGSALTLYVKLSDNIDFNKLTSEPAIPSIFSEKTINALKPDRSLDGAAKKAAEEEDRPFINAVIMDDDGAFAASMKSTLESVQGPLGCVFNISLISPSPNAAEEIKAAGADIVFIEPVTRLDDGFDIILQIKSQPENLSLPLIAVSKIKCQNKAVKMGATGYISKPVNAAALINVAKTCLVHKLSDNLDFEKALNNLNIKL
ncbi:MAG TPA: hybrid sensor histidine kinase/response regulator [Candidatus Wallbacteria bacterium]|nr:hybrid sensor histidine kinase/response regulator [Candidatus Wallbacteria bacterium]